MKVSAYFLSNLKWWFEKLNYFLSKGGGSNPFKNLEKASVLQETRTFNETPINAKKCCFILTKILYMINQVNNRMKHFN